MNRFLLAIVFCCGVAAGTIWSHLPASAPAAQTTPQAQRWVFHAAENQRGYLLDSFTGDVWTIGRDETGSDTLVPIGRRLNNSGQNPFRK